MLKKSIGVFFDQFENHLREKDFFHSFSFLFTMWCEKDRLKHLQVHLYTSNIDEVNLNFIE